MLALLLLGQAPTPEAVLKRFDQYMASADTLSVTVKTKFNGSALGTGVIRIDRPTRFSASVATPNGVQSITFTEAGVLEVNQGTKYYAEHPMIGRLYNPEFKVTQAVQYSIPQMILRGSAQGSFPKETNPKVATKVMLNGIATDQITGKMSGMGGTSELRANFDSAGRLLKFYSKIVSPQGTLLIEQDLSAYVANAKFAADQFSIRKPIGYVPYELDRAGFGIPQGETMPSVSLKATDSGQSASLKSLMSGKNALIVIADPEFHANSEMFKSIQQISKKIPDYKLIVISSKRDAASGKKLGVTGSYFDPTGAQLERLMVPGAPAMYLVDKKGKVAQMFFGFDGEWTGLDKAIYRLKAGG